MHTHIGRSSQQQNMCKLYAVLILHISNITHKIISTLRAYMHKNSYLKKNLINKERKSKQL